MTAANEVCFFDLFDSIVNSSASTAEKLIALIIGRHFYPRREGAYPSRARVTQQASCSLPTFKRAQPALGAFFDIQERRGKTTVYSPKPILVEEVEEAVLSLRKRSARAPAHDDTGYQGDATSRDQSDTGVGIKMIPQKESLKNLPKKESSLRSDSPPAEAVEELTPERMIWGKCAQWLIRKTGKPDRQVKALIGKWLKIVTHVELLEHFRACRDSGADPIPYLTAIVMRAEKTLMERCRRENGRIVAVNGFRQELETLLGGRDLQRSLDRINGNIPQHIVGSNLEAKVRSEIIKLVDIEQSWERRSTNIRGNKPSTDELWLDRQIADATRDGLLV